MRKNPIRKEPGDHSQTCIFCNAHGQELKVYALGVGRIGICRTCAGKAVEALDKHAEEEAKPLAA